MRNKITIIGAGQVGASCAQQIAQKSYADIVMVDIIEGAPQGKALDLLQSGPIIGSDSRLIGTNSYEETADSDITIITSGLPRKLGMSRDDLVLANMEVVKGVTEKVVKYSPDCIIIVVTNPLDVMAQLVLHITKFPKSRVLGMSGILDTARFKTLLAIELDVSAEDISACVLGGHGDAMVPIPRLTTVGSIPITELLPEETIDRIMVQTVKAGGEIISLLKTGSAYYAPAAAVAQMVEAVILDKKRILPVSAYLEGEYGIHGVFIGVPAKLGKDGIAQIIEIKLTPREEAALKKSAQSVQELISIMKLS